MSPRSLALGYFLLMMWPKHAENLPVVIVGKASDGQWVGLRTAVVET
jgi:hypothetical protein